MGISSIRREALREEAVRKNKLRGKCSPHPNNMFYHCGRCCAEIKCTDKSCPWVTACKKEDYQNCEHYVKPTEGGPT